MMAPFHGLDKFDVTETITTSSSDYHLSIQGLHALRTRDLLLISLSSTFTFTTLCLSSPLSVFQLPTITSTPHQRYFRSLFFESLLTGEKYSPSTAPKTPLRVTPRPSLNRHCPQTTSNRSLSSRWTSG